MYPDFRKGFRVGCIAGSIGGVLWFAVCYRIATQDITSVALPSSLGFESCLWSASAAFAVVGFIVGLLAAVRPEV
jgi:hypothetical protein